MIEAKSRRRQPAALTWSFPIFVLIAGFNSFGWNQYVPIVLQPLVAPPVLRTSSTAMEVPCGYVDGISLVTSFWAASDDVNDRTKHNEHRHEIEGSILLNLHNPHLREVVVILDSVSENTTDCAGFVNYMTRKLENVTRSLPLFGLPTPEPATLPRLECIERRGPFSGQPTYFEMFHYATFHPSITSDKIIVTNPDQVFDESLVHAKKLPYNTIFVLATNGYDVIPQHIHQLYEAYIGPDDGRRKSMNWCFVEEMRMSMSWDSYIFHRSLLVDTLPGSDAFKRLNFWRVPTAYYMNEFGAEYAALHDITRGLIGKVTIWNACHLIRTWHFHLEEKMHVEKLRWSRMSRMEGGGYIYYEDYGPVIPIDFISIGVNETFPNEPTDRVPTPSVFSRLCVNVTLCFAENPLGVDHNEPQQDALQVRLMQTNTTPTFGH